MIGTGRIAYRFFSEAEVVRDIQVVGVYNPHIDSAKKYCEHFHLKFGTDDLNVFLEQIDAVYIASPHETHGDYIRQALERKKHVLCEKPMVLKKEEAMVLYELADKNKCVLMEAIKTAYCPGFLQLLSITSSGMIGEIRDVEAAFTKLEKPDSRELNDLEYGGSFLELGSYPLLAIIKLLGTEYRTVSFETIRDDRGIDLYTKAYFRFYNSMATAKTGLGVKSEGELIVSGTKGYIIVPAPWWKTTEIEVRFENMERNQKFHYDYLGDGLRYEIEAFLAAICDNKSEENLEVGKKESIVLAEIIDKFLQVKE